MRFIPTRLHGVLDYLVGTLLIAAPWLLNFNRGGAETWVPVILGVGALGELAEGWQVPIYAHWLEL